MYVFLWAFPLNICQDIPVHYPARVGDDGRIPENSCVSSSPNP